MIPGLEYYRPSGQPATSLIAILSVPLTGSGPLIQITDLGGLDDVYTYGTHFAGRDVFEIAASLAAALNSDKTLRADIPSSNQPIRPYYAIPFGSNVRVIATTPGVLGTDLTLSSSDETVFSVDGGASANLVSTSIGGQGYAVSLATSSSGSTWVEGQSIPCSSVYFLNTTGTTIRIGCPVTGAGGAYILLPTALGILVPTSNFSKIFIQRDDQSNTPVTLRGILS